MNNDFFNENHLEITKIQGLGKNRTLEGKGQSKGQYIGVSQYTDIKLIKMSDNEMPGDWTSGLTRLPDFKTVKSYDFVLKTFLLSQKLTRKMTLKLTLDQ